jgi:hypothetical protein
MHEKCSENWHKIRTWWAIKEWSDGNPSINSCDDGDDNEGGDDKQRILVY